MPNLFTKPKGQSSNRGISAELWANCPREEIMFNFDKGHYYQSDFVTYPTGEWTLTQAGSAGTAALDDEVGGVLLISAGDSDDGDGPQIQLGTANGESFLPVAGTEIWFEMRVKLGTNSTTTGADMFFGLSETDTTVIASSANTSTNHIGAECVTEDNILLGYGEKAGTRNSTGKTVTTLTTSYKKFGFYVNGVTSAQFWVDGAKVGTALATANIPIVELRPTIVCQSSDTITPTIEIDWISVFERNA